MNNLCDYCGIFEIAENYNSSCVECVYTCAGCNKITPWENGGADDMPEHCDECWAKAHATKTTQQQGDTQMKNTLYTVVGFDDETQAYQVVGTTTSDIDPSDMVELLGKQDMPTDFENVIANFINAEVESMVALATSRERAKGSGMTRAEHKPVVMRMGEWRSLIFALEQIDINEVRPHNDVNNGVSVEQLLRIIKSSLESTQAVVGNA